MTSLNDLCQLHLEWIRKHPSFVPFEGVEPTPERGCPPTYLETMSLMYEQFLSFKNPNLYIESVAKMFKIDIRTFDSYESRLADFKTASNIAQNKDLSYFCTIGFNYQTFTIQHCIKVINTILSFPWIITCRAVFEYHRENGEHPHVHFLLTCKNEKQLKYGSKVAEKLWATSGIKKIVLKKSFIDVKTAIPYHSKYILLEKRECKIPFVLKDIEWRKQNNIPEFFEK